MSLGVGVSSGLPHGTLAGVNDGVTRDFTRDVSLSLLSMQTLLGVSPLSSSANSGGILSGTSLASDLPPGVLTGDADGVTTAVRSLFSQGFSKNFARLMELVSASSLDAFVANASGVAMPVGCIGTRRGLSEGSAWNSAFTKMPLGLSTICVVSSVVTAEVSFGIMMSNGSTVLLSSTVFSLKGSVASFDGANAELSFGINLYFDFATLLPVSVFSSKI
mmetsp:Transcript_14769/g.31456  ORF Transcript_14769/g.31456 Transcript_14769/m.31456 type:complete len:219 (+) Transcript_14769:603-1259(+)